MGGGIIKPTQDIAKGAQRQKEQQIAQKQDEIVHGQNLNNIEKGKLNFELKQLYVDKDILITEQEKVGSMTKKEMDEANMRIIDNEINEVKDDYVNGKSDFGDYKDQLFGFDMKKLEHRPKSIYLPENYPVEEDWGKYINFDAPPNRGMDNNINPELIGRLAYMAKQEGIILQIGSGYRSNAQQKSLDENGDLAAPAGKSWHEYGLAVDCKNKTNKKFLENLPKGYLEKYGLTRRAVVDGTWEWWHITPIDVYPDGKSIPGADRKNWALENAYYNGIDIGFGG